MGQSASTFEENGVLREPLIYFLMGATGHGKSYLGNSILGRNVFKISDNLTSQTQVIMCGYTEFERYSLKVLDEPGLGDTQLNKVADTERVIQNTRIRLSMCPKGVDALLFVFRFDMFSSEVVSALETLKIIFGKDYFKHVIVVLTGGDQFLPYMEEINFRGTFDELCKQQTGPFRELYKACQGRFVLFNNLENNRERQIAQREQLIEITHNLKSRNGRYTADSFRLAAAGREKMVIQLKAPILKETIKKQSAIIFTMIHKYFEQPSHIQKVEIQTAIDKLKNVIHTQDKGHGLLIDLMRFVLVLERQLEDVDKLTALMVRF